MATMRHGTHTEHVDKNGTPLVVGDKLQSETGQNFSIDRYGRLVDVVGHPVTNAKPADLEFVCHADLSGRKPKTAAQPKASAEPKPEQPKPANKKKARRAIRLYGRGTGSRTYGTRL